ncbi:hypothetical protein SLNWT_1438 [Streptomyces albus]|uniref:Uncharacterized protein n=1 Tax=Streptomyces albus (strain ATCC 21838 / DSM 41398 / FERM P-419 / JCM 4703 / NBRC 107858) TaxID=1081613 RepID=A0A0B5EJY4_STRA4|nr:hypothetical protein SLNWT_1438 [Streptomyces albus]AOU76130.1 hypothetical protein SLNHY_1439 [Streptomyces albus]AYN31921.1 hypothetical protein DUI70_1418 [Streptomyces albus]
MRPWWVRGPASVAGQSVPRPGRAVVTPPLFPRRLVQAREVIVRTYDPSVG